MRPGGGDGGPVAGSLARVLGALADPTRLAILERLRAGEASVSELAAPFSMGLPAVHKHLQVLASAGLVESRKTGRVRRVALRAVALREATDLLDSYRPFWAERFDAHAPFIDLSDMDVA